MLHLKIFMSIIFKKLVKNSLTVCRWSYSLSSLIGESKWQKNLNIVMDFMIQWLNIWSNLVMVDAQHNFLEAVMTQWLDTWRSLEMRMVGQLYAVNIIFSIITSFHLVLRCCFLSSMRRKYAYGIICLIGFIGSQISLDWVLMFSKQGRQV